MATRTVANGGGNYSSTSTWVEGAVPTSADSVVFTSTSGSLTIDVASSALSINFTNFVNTITFNAELTVAGGGVNLGTGGYIQAGSFGITVNTSSTITSGNVIWSRTWTFAGTSQTYTLSGTLSVTGSITINATTQVTISSGTLNIGGNFTHTAGLVVGTSTFVFNGTGTWSSGVALPTLRNNVNINTGGILTISGSLSYNVGTITFTSGTVVTTGSTLNTSVSIILNTNGMTWNAISIGTSTPTTVTINSTLSAASLSIAAGIATTFSGTSSFNVDTWTLLHQTTITITLTSLRTYTVNTLFTAVNTSPAARLSIRASSAGSRANITLGNSASQALGYVNFTDISATGKTIRTFGGTLSNTLNVQSFTSPQTVGG